MRLLSACAVVLFIGSMVASAQDFTMNEGFYVTRTADVPSDWVAGVKITNADTTETEMLGDTGGGVAYLRFMGDATTANGSVLFAFTGPDQAHPRMTVGQVTPNGAYLTFMYRLANPSGGQALDLAMGLSANDWAAQPAGAPCGQANGVFLYGTANLHESSAEGWWREGRIDLGPSFAQTLDPATEVNRIWIHSLGWAVNAETVLDIDNVVFHNGSVQNHPGDFNNDKTISDADYTIWANYYNQAVPAGYFDGNGDGIYTDADYTIWANGYGQTFSNVVVPEPATMSLLGLGLFGLLRRRSA